MDTLGVPLLAEMIHQRLSLGERAAFISGKVRPH